MTSCLHGVPSDRCFLCAADSPWCTARQAADALGRTPSRIGQMCRRGELDAQRMNHRRGQSWRITRVSVVEELARRASEAARPQPAYPSRPIEERPLPIPKAAPVEPAQALAGRWQHLTVEAFVRKANEYLARV